MAQPQVAYRYKFILLGDRGAGKTAWLTKLTTGVYNKNTPATISTSMTLVRRHMSSGQTVEIELWDTSGDRETAGLDIGSWVGAHGALIFVDGTLPRRAQMESFREWRRAFSYVCPGITGGVVTTKRDSKNYHRSSKLIGAYTVSSKRNSRVERPLLKLVNRRLGIRHETFIKE